MTNKQSKLKPTEPVGIKTFKQRKWYSLYMELDGNATEAAMQAYDCTSRKAASVIGTENLAKLSGPISDLMDFMGLSDDKLMAKLSEGLDAMKTEIGKDQGRFVTEKDYIDYPTRRSYLELSLKMRGLLKDIIKHEGRVAVYDGDKSPEDYIESAISKG